MVLQHFAKMQQLLQFLCTIREIHRLKMAVALTLSLPTTTIVASPLNVIKWQMGFNSAA
jgi:hypothetical protein